MKKLSLLLALSLALAASASFAQQNQNQDENERKQKSKGCHYRCVDGEMVMYKGNKKVPVVEDRSGGQGTIADMLGSSTPDCPAWIDEQTLTLERTKKLNEDCETIKSFKRKGNGK